jgi:DNA-binding protein Fis
MGCGCKNKGNQQQAQAAPQQVASQRQPVQNQTVQESVKKVIEKYYNKK